REPPPPSGGPRHVPINIQVEGGGGVMGGEGVLEWFVGRAQELIRQRASFSHADPVTVALILQIGAGGAAPAPPPRVPDVRGEAEREHFIDVINKKIRSLAKSRYAQEGKPYVTAWVKEFEEVHGIRFSEAKEQWGTARLEREAERLTLIAAAA